MDLLNMLNIINFLEIDCSEDAGGIGTIIRLATSVVHLLQFAIPLALIIFGMLDLGKAVISSKEDEMKKAQGTLLKRFLYAVLVFLIITIVGFVMGLVSDSGVDTGGDTWSDCWNEYW